MPIGAAKALHLVLSARSLHSAVMSSLLSAEPWRARYAHPCEWDLDFPPLAMTELFATSTSTYGSRALIDFYGRIYTYDDVMAEARSFAAGLQRQGITKGDRVGIFLANVPSYVTAYFGILMAGATVVNFSPLYTAEELDAQVVDSGTRLIVTLDAPSLLPKALTVLRDTSLEGLIVARLADQLPALMRWGLRLFRRSELAEIPDAPDIVPWEEFMADAVPSPVVIDALHDIAMLQYTGGTTGRPKGAMLTHQNLSANARQINATDPHRGERDVMMGVLPFFHIFANSTVLNRTIADGGCVVMLPRFDAAQCLKAIERTRATSMPGVPTMFQALLDHPHIGKADLSSLRICISGGAPLPAPLKKAFEERTGAKLAEGYGLTESSGVVTTNPYEDVTGAGGERPGSIGQPLPATRLRLLDKEDPTKDAAPGEPGELAILGPQVMAGYWKLPEAAAEAFAIRHSPEGETEQWLRTGDVALFDEDGFVRIVDRMKDMIAVGGFKVFPSAVEAVALHHPAVREVLVIGAPDAYRGESPRAYVALHPGSTDTGEDIAEWLNDQVGKHERVDKVVVQEALPRTPIGKLDRKALRALVAAETLAETTTAN